MPSQAMTRVVLSLALCSALGGAKVALAQNDEAQRRSDQEAARQQRESDRKAAQQQRESDQESARQQRQSDRESARQQRESDQKSQGRLSEARQRRLIAEQRQQLERYHARLQAQERSARQHAAALRAQRRQSQYELQQRYLDGLRRQQLEAARWRGYDYERDPYFRTAPSYRYSRDGRQHETNEYGAQQLRQAVNHGYEQGVRAGRADRDDGWRADYRSSYAYRDANYGYNGLYVNEADYNHYFREGFRRGYEDGHSGRSNYGRGSNGALSILENVMAAILSLQQLR
jgi:hypothetical protein